jgi:Domain of unknown function (DUF5916)/Carbohydrate family 9 binding domain-like
MLNKILPCLWLIGLVLALPVKVLSQEEAGKTLRIVKTSEPITIDGLENESSWSTTGLADQFINKWPLDTGLAKLQTKVRLLYDDKYLYVFAIMEVQDNNLVIQSLKRDVNPYYSEGFSIVLDPTGQKASGFTFGVNASGAQFDGIAQYNSVSFEMDSKWYSATRRYEKYWTAELAIPFKTLRFPADKSAWGINFIRNDMHNNCFSTWNRVPVQYFGANLGRLGNAAFDGIPRKPSNNNSFIPYINTNITHDSSTKLNFRAGLDARIAVSSSLNLAVTINPDFSQVDVDQQVINLDRYSIFLPEKRLFFLENSDLYSNLGSTNIRPYFSRKIGLTDDGQPITLLGGARLNGYLNTKTRIEVMDMQSGRQQNSFYQNYFTTVIERQVLKRSNVRLYYTDSEFFGDSAFKSGGADKYNRVAGAEFTYVAPRGNFDVGAKISGTLTPSVTGDNLFSNINMDYFSTHLNFSSQFNQIGKNYIPTIGFTPRLYNYDAASKETIRLGYYENTSHVEYDMYPKNKSHINMLVAEFNPSVFLNERDGSLNEADLGFKYSILFANRRTFYVGWIQKIINLPFETSIFSGLDNFKPGYYRFGYLQLDYESNFLKPFSWSVNTEIGNYFNGNRFSATAKVLQRIQPWGNFGIMFNYNHIEVEGKEVNPLIISPTIELAFNRNMFLTAFSQYNSDIHNFNINTKFQWRFQPASDLFLVYSSNYITPGYIIQGYSFTMKLVYWLN